MQQYLDLIKDVLTNGVDSMDRTKTGTRSVFGRQMRFNLNAGFPLLTTKKVHLKSIIHEVLWFLQGSTNVKYLQDNGVTIWDEWSDQDGNLGPVYGAQWRSWGGYADRSTNTDQIKNLIHDLKTNPSSRRHLVSAWNVEDIESMALPPCHYAFQCYVRDGELSLMFHMRSVDVFLGLPFNIASYALLTLMLAQVTGLKPGTLIWTGGDVHLYSNHFAQAFEQIKRSPRPLPQMTIKQRGQTIDDFEFADFEIVGYDPLPAIPAKVAV